MSGVASLLGIGADDLKSELQGGASLAGVASQHGVSQDQLLQTIQSSLKARNPDATDASLAAAAQRIAGHHGHHHHGGQGAGAATSSTTTLDAVAGVLGLNSSDLVKELQAGTPLSDIGQQQGVSATDLANLLGKGLLADVKA
jgi:hypothetical protein